MLLVIFIPMAQITEACYLKKCQNSNNIKEQARQLFITSKKVLKT